MKCIPNYDYTVHRRKAFIIANNKIYSRDLHSECLRAYLNDIYNCNEEDNKRLENLSESELEVIIDEDIILGETSCFGTILYNSSDIEKVKRLKKFKRLFICNKDYIERII